MSITSNDKNCIFNTIYITDENLNCCVACQLSNNYSINLSSLNQNYNQNYKDNLDLINDQKNVNNLNTYGSKLNYKYIKSINYKKIILQFLEKWMVCDCFKNTKNQIKMLMFLKNFIKHIKEEKLISEVWINNIRKILRYKIHIKDQLTTIYWSIYNEIVIKTL
jgi:hypothetical protein